jgi:chaperonin GroEL
MTSYPLSPSSTHSLPLPQQLDKIDASVLGTAKKVTLTKDDTIIMDGAGSKADITERCGSIREQIKSTTSEYEKEKLQERLAKLSGGVAVIKVGGASEVEVGEKKDRVVDALNATRAAVEEGILPGGGVALLYASKVLDKVAEEAANFDIKVGVNIVRSALREPCTLIAGNAGVEGAVVVGKLLENSIGSTIGYNAYTAAYVDMFQCGVIDPLKVRCLLPPLRHRLQLKLTPLPHCRLCARLCATPPPSHPS